MSVLNFPRIYLNGHMFWNPPTGNNNDTYPLYDAVKMELNWPFLKYYNITPENADTYLMPWLITPRVLHEAPDYVTQVPGNVSNSPPTLIPGEWDLFGDNGCGTVSYNDIKSVISGGELPGGGYVSQDPLINQGFNLFGNPFGSNSPTPARFVDISPWQNTFTALYFDRLVLGNDQCGLTAKRQYRMLDRFLNFNWATLGGLFYVTATWQTCFPKENLTWALGGSTLLQNLQQQMDQQGAQGLMLRFSSYLTCYDKNGIFNNYPPINTHSTAPLDMAQVQDMYQKGLDNVGSIFFNPAYSRTSGTLGLWFADEYPTAPGGRRLVGSQAVTLKRPGQPDKSQTLGIIPVQAHDNTLSLDLLNGFPFYPLDKTAAIPDAEKFDAGSYEIGVRQGSNFTSVGSFGFDDYKQSEFVKRSGILDLPLSADAQKLLASGSLELQLQGTTPATVATQQMWTAEVVDSGSFIDVGDTRTLQIMVQYDGLPAPAGTALTVVEYNNPYLVGTSDYYLAFSNPADFTLFNDYPDDRVNNSSVLPQFVDMPTAPQQVNEGNGRQLVAVRPTVRSATMQPVSYQQYLTTPGAVALSPCLTFGGAVQTEGVLQGQNTTVQYSYTQIQTDANGIATLSMTAVAAGFPTLRFFLHENGQAPDIPFSFSYFQTYADFLAPVRVLPQEPQMEEEFVNAWNAIYHNADCGQQIWETFIYPRILEPFYYLYPIMDKYMPLNSLSRIEGAIDQLIVLVSKEYQLESTLAMPITRDLPQSRRAILELWATKLVKLNYPPQPLSMGDYASI
ncbi:hypothetical protein V0R50_27530 [Pseudomonas sp. 148P]|uniref:Uncharacterized protein n=1 Tax=Pseudomonas ulcerans TaxID=3115852 RepID=A0ABU7I038_9PSED|nr:MULTISPECIES: hypothetical protein [unclassified Pseudomonas]MEE1925555.1 hypothetical protein [Pseudomonas sp. 147P]MEE1936991.1 hypothetical protein [Pseudomonas sp. 148P]